MWDSSARRRVAAGLSAALLVLLAGCSGGGEAEEAGEVGPSPTPTTLAEVDAAGVEVPRLEFCGLVPDAAVAAALGSEPESGDARAPGDPAEPDGPSLQEVGCTWRADGVVARAWVFAQPVGEAQAGRVVSAAEDRRGCRTETPAAAAAYGDPSVVQRCGGDGRGQRVRYAGLFGDSWLTCELQGRGVADRAEAWCVSVLTSLDPAA